MTKGIDCAAPLTDAKLQLFKADGVMFIGRYLADSGSWKRLSPGEAQQITDEGIYIVSLFERYANRVREGARAGEFDGLLALQYAREVGQPEGSTIYACVDYDAQPNDYELIEAYLRSFDEQIEGYEVGVYGSYAIVQEMHERGVTSKLMQTLAWSKGQVYEFNSLYQHQIDVTVHAHQVDLCESNGDAGGWQVGMIKPIEPQLSVEDAAAITGYLGVLWQLMPTAESRDEVHRLANVVRMAAGVETE